MRTHWRPHIRPRAARPSTRPVSAALIGAAGILVTGILAGGCATTSATSSNTSSPSGVGVTTASAAQARWDRSPGAVVVLGPGGVIRRLHRRVDGTRPWVCRYYASGGGSDLLASTVDMNAGPVVPVAGRTVTLMCVDRQTGVAADVVTFVYTPADPMPGIAELSLPGGI